ncbi:glycine-rich domain-containing protein [Kaarinaea lacus]
MDWLVIITILTLLAGITYLFLQNRQKRQLAFIKNYHFHRSIRERIIKKYPHLTEDQSHLVFRALRDYFVICNQANRRMVAMPSQVVDDAWHEFILFTRAYKKFCDKAIGRFLHHTPTEAMTTPTLAQEGIKRAWRLACAKEKIIPDKPNRLPLLFAIDAMLNIPNGFTYVLNCQDKQSPVYGDGYCAGHIGCASGCGGSSGAGDNSSGGFFDGLFDSSGCGGDCGGGCGGD